MLSTFGLGAFEADGSSIGILTWLTGKNAGTTGAVKGDRRSDGRRQVAALGLAGQPGRGR